MPQARRVTLQAGLPGANPWVPGVRAELGGELGELEGLQRPRRGWGAETGFVLPERPQLGPARWQDPLAVAGTPAHVFWCLAKKVGLAAGTGMPASLWEEILAANQSRSMSSSGGGCCRCSAELCLSRSAGIGRTGCFIATRIGCQQLKEKGEVDILGIVCRLRIDRSERAAPGRVLLGAKPGRRIREGCGAGVARGHGDRF